MIMVPTWLLIFTLASGQSFLGGEYQTLEQCREGAAMQIDFWRHKHGRITWRCRFAPVQE